MDLIVTIVRHGNTFEPGEAPRRIGARTDLPLVESGRAQARRLAETLGGFDRVLAAPLLRTRATAETILAQRRAAPAIETADWLTEIDHGPDEDRTEPEVIARIGADALAAWDAEARPPSDWIVDEAARIAGWRDLWAQGAGRVLIVTSNGAARFALRSDPVLWAQAVASRAGAAAGATASHSIKLRTGAYGTIARDARGLRLLDWDRRP